MPLPLEGRVVALAETRQLEDLAAMLSREGALPMRVPMVAILDADPVPVAAWLRDLVADRFGYVVLMTGEGVRRMMPVAGAEGMREAVIAAFGRARVVTRGPKPGQALKELGLKPDKVADVPTTEGLITTLSRESLNGQTVGVQFHGHDNPPLVAAIEGAGATAVPVRPYYYAPSADAEKVVEMIRKMAEGAVDLLVITSSPQADRIWQVASERGLEDELRRGLGRTAVASVGPIATETLVKYGARVDICPDQGWVMKKLVHVINRELDAKRPR